MKKIVRVCLTMVFLLSVFGCNYRQSEFVITIVIPAGQQEGFTYASSMILPLKSKITLSTEEGLDDVEIMLTSDWSEEQTHCESVYVKSGIPVEVEAKKGECYKLGVNVSNPTDEDMTVSINVEGITLAIE